MKSLRRKLCKRHTQTKTDFLTLFVSLHEEQLVSTLNDVFLFLYTNDKQDEKQTVKGEPEGGVHCSRKPLVNALAVESSWVTLKQWPWEGTMRTQ